MLLVVQVSLLRFWWPFLKAVTRSHDQSVKLCFEINRRNHKGNKFKRLFFFLNFEFITFPS